ncbi:unnamed protein product, partial [Phaeothamnion confervicola]
SERQVRPGEHNRCEEPPAILRNVNSGTEVSISIKMRSDVSVAPPCTDLSLEKWENAFQRKKDEHATLGTSFVAASFPVREVSFAVHSTDPSQCATIKRATLRLAQDLSLGVGGCLWDCGIRIAQFLGEHIGIVADRRVLELGSGTGVAGLAAASCGAAIVVLTDLPELISLLEQNVTANGLAATAVVCSYAWGSLVDTRCAGSDASSDSAHEKHLSGSAAFDVVICCDCSYCCNEVAASEDLLAALLRFVAGDTLLLLAHKRRGDDAELALFQRLDEHF